MKTVANLTLAPGRDERELYALAAKRLGVKPGAIEELQIQRRSLDARRKGAIKFVYTVAVRLKGSPAEPPESYEIPRLTPRGAPVVVAGFGPAGMFCALTLARAGLRPIVLERGADVDTRTAKVRVFRSGGELDGECNVQFGEGGAGTFSDGKLNTLVKDPKGRNRLVLETFVQAGAPEEILYWNKPHLGTDVLTCVVERIREEILSLGGEVRFGTKVTDIDVQDGAVRGVRVRRRMGAETKAGAEVKAKAETEEYLPCEALVLAIGHSARDTFAMLAQKQIPMEQKAFAVGVRIEHPQELVNESQYGRDYPPQLPAASYKLTRKVSGDRGVYSFCMCPGGYVVNASSEEGFLAVNGMSYQARDGRNANSAMIVTVRPEDFGGGDVLAGVEFQRRLERAAYRAAGGKIPVQLLADFQKKQRSLSLGEVEPSMKGAWEFGDVRGIFPEVLSAALEEGILGCEHILPGFSRGDALLSGVESRTSSPVRILRDERLESAVRGLYPCGEGAGYAGGITSAAMDGVKTAEAVAARYRTGKEN